MFETQFSHFLSYGASDQETVKELREVYEGLLVPGTVAAFQKEGTGGFVLSLSASESQIPYVIDPRSPLFQQEILSPKKSHVSLRKILGIPDGFDPKPETFDANLIKVIADRWVKFNGKYQEKAGGKFAKYAERLGEEGLNLESALSPHVILPPYFVANSVDDAWWKVSSNIYDATCDVAKEVVPDKGCIRVVATEHASSLNELCKSLSEDAELIVWVSGLNELRAHISDLVAYGGAIKQSQTRGQKVFGLYGGFFSVVLGSSGLRGISHGIGYGESRDWVELPQSGPPPQRYYIEPFHRYVRQELAEQLWQANVYRCTCKICKSTTPLLLKYHGVMKHSVYCRSNEIESWAGLSISDCHKNLTKEYDDVLKLLESASLKKIYKQQAESGIKHLPTWITALSQLSSSSN